MEIRRRHWLVAGVLALSVHGGLLLAFKPTPETPTARPLILQLGTLAGDARDAGGGENGDEGGDEGSAAGGDQGVNANRLAALPGGGAKLLAPLPSTMPLAPVGQVSSIRPLTARPPERQLQARELPAAQPARPAPLPAKPRSKVQAKVKPRAEPPIQTRRARDAAPPRAPATSAAASAPSDGVSAARSRAATPGAQPRPAPDTSAQGRSRTADRDPVGERATHGGGRGHSGNERGKLAGQGQGSNRSGARGNGQGSGVGSGPGTGQASGRGSGQGSGISAAGRSDYYSRIAAWLARHKSYPSRARRLRLEGTVSLRFTIDRRGRVLAQRIVKSSGHALLDQEASNLLQRAAPLPPFPKGMTESQISITLPIAFQLR